eukprot:gnl/TRDRNA2_/TRDRNA2_42139_c0_seq1.p1 gnl/TRDRNA2_/TRDRNA2_42139_c0~~gnl/TRDRNA2_/TRDRNA2_42139_c0_seq1.p1  ORF type:complete len:668 (-),score=147.31 gnl/TRDRNA2_/TRDRNA2_42139_c0_seq1:99-2102(-)
MPGIDVVVNFSFRGQQWSHEFNVARSSTVHQLKELMLKDGDPSESDVQSFELRKNGRRVPDFESITKETKFDFAWIGPEEGAVMAEADRAFQEERRKRLEAGENLGDLGGEDAQKDKECMVEVVVKHAMDSSELKVQISTTATVENLRRLVMEKIGERRLGEVKLVKRIGNSFTSLSNEERVGERREFLSMGRTLVEIARVEASKDTDLQAKQDDIIPLEVDVTVKHAVQDNESQIVVSVKPTQTILDLRAAVTKALGETRISEVKIVKKTGGAWQTMNDGERIGERREFLSMGRVLTVQIPPAPAVADVKFRIVSQQDQSARELSIKQADATIGDLKAKLCDLTSRGPPSRVALLYKSKELSDSLRLDTLTLDQQRSIECSGISVGPPVPVEVTVTHAHEGHSIRVRVSDTGTVLDVRRAVVAELGCSMSDVRLVTRQISDSMVSIPDTQRLHGRILFDAMGKGLEQPAIPRKSQLKTAAAASAPAAGESRESYVKIVIDRASNFEVPAKVKLPMTVLQLKEQLAAADPTGKAKPHEFRLLVPGAEAPLPDSAELSSKVTEYEIVGPAEVAEGPTAAAPKEPKENDSPVEVTVSHAANGTSVKITVPANATILECRRAIMNKIGSNKLSDVKCVKKTGGAFTTLGGDEKLKGRTTLLTMGSDLKCK